MHNIKEIRYGDYTARINLSRGANCISLRNSKYEAEILREPDYSKELDNPYLYGMPILFPVNRISGGRFEFEGREYIFPINEEATGCHLHGEMHIAEFEQELYEENRIVCSYEAESEKPYFSFPHGFRIMLEYVLCEEGFVHTTSITNLSGENMPCFIGFHTTFNTLFAKGNLPENTFAFADITEEFERNMSNYLPTGNKPEFDEISTKLSQGKLMPYSGMISRHFRSGETGRMGIYDKGTNLSLVYENDSKYGFRLIYNGGKDGYICLEPQNCMANCANSLFGREEAGFDYIRPGETKSYTSKIYIAEGDMR